MQPKGRRPRRENLAQVARGSRYQLEVSERSDGPFITQLVQHSVYHGTSDRGGSRALTQLIPRLNSASCGCPPFARRKTLAQYTTTRRDGQLILVRGTGCRSALTSQTRTPQTPAPRARSRGRRVRTAAPTRACAAVVAKLLRATPPAITHVSEDDGLIVEELCAVGAGSECSGERHGGQHGAVPEARSAAGRADLAAGRISRPQASEPRRRVR